MVLIKMIIKKMMVESLRNEVKPYMDVKGIYKDELRIKLIELIENGTINADDFREKHKLCFAGYEVEELIKCTKTERQKWTKDGRLKVAYYDSVRNYGKTISVPYYDNDLIYQMYIDGSIIEKWRKDDKEKSSLARKNGAIKAKETRQKNDIIRNKFKEDLQSRFDKWESDGEEKAVIFNLAYWTMWMSRYAKVYESQRRLASNFIQKEKLENLRDVCYDKKERAIEVMVKSNLSKVEYYKSNKKKYNWRDYEEDYDEYDFDEEEYDDDKYYDLYYIEVGDGDTKFSFHLPYDCGRFFLPESESLKLVKHIEQEGEFRFGRSLKDIEKVALSYKKVCTNFDKALKNATEYVKAYTNNCVTK